MREHSSFSNAVANELHNLAAGLRTGTVSLTEMPHKLLSLLGQLHVEAGPESGELISAEDTLPPVEQLVHQLQAFIRATQPNPGALDLNQEPPLELIIEDNSSTSAHSAADLLGLEGPSVTAQTVKGGPSEHDLSTPRLPPSTEQLPHVLNALPATRYEVRSLLGHGGQGDVREIYDRSLQRVVALKVLREEFATQPHSRRSFLREACLTAQLSHPSIVPIYDVGELASGAPCYTMKRIRGRSLRDVMQARRRGEAWAEEFTRRRLLEILVQVAHAVGYAHHRGVIHRDLKPANLMVGDYGEVLVVDWGIARLMRSLSREPDENAVVLDPTHEPTSRGTIKGTPAYMAPEQARADLKMVGPWSDVHALGLILYEVLLGEPARSPGAADDVVAQARTPITRSPETRRLEEDIPAEAIPEELNQMCMKCLTLEPHLRYHDGEAFAKALRAHLDGQRQRELSEHRAMEGEALFRETARIDAQLAGVLETVKAARAQIEPWLPIDEKRAVWNLETTTHELERERDDVMTHAMNAFTQALDYEPGNQRARAGLARLYYERLIQAERLGRIRDARQFEAQVRRLDDGSLIQKMRSAGSLFIQTQPDRAEVWLYQYEASDRMLRPTSGRKLGRTPVEVDELPVGRYLIVLRMRGGKEVYYPVLIARQTRWEGSVRLHPELDDRFVHIPAGPFIFGGDRQAANASPREELWVGDFAIAKYPVTCKEYLRFLNALPQDEALTRLPRASRLYGGNVWWPIENHQIQIPRVDEAGGRWDPRYPIRAISRRDAESYTLWRAQLEELPLRLPTEVEWEKAARGVDGRVFPWGDSFDATFCKMRDSRQGRAEPEPTGAFPTDRSPYGIHDMAGSISEWCLDAFERSFLMGTLKGGNWRGSESTCRLARRTAADPDEPEPHAGFRMAMDVMDR